MRNRILAVLCLVAILSCVLVAPAAANGELPAYQVGYSIKDMNPWVDPNDHSQGILPIALTGNGNDYDRTCTGMMDDNDDGVIGEGDGLYTTCTAVTDPYGNTVMYITIDSLQGYGVITKDVRAAIVEQLGKDVITSEQIMVNGSHSHSSAYFAGLKSSTDATYGEAFRAYYQYVISQITAAAIEAYNDRETATMTKGSIDARESTAHLGYNGGQGYHMNAIRHYDMEISNGKTTKQYVSGSNFGRTGSTIGATLNLKGLSGYKVTSNDNAVESDNTMHVLQFAFDESSGKEPILLVNWRAHTTNNSSGDNKTFLSSDYVNSLRANLKKAGYRAAFLQGAAGNVVMNSVTRTDWSAETGKKDSNVYGRILADIAVDCVERKMTDPLPAGQIRTIQCIYQGQIQQDSEGLLAAANQYKADTDVLQETNPNTFPSVPYVYTHTDGEKYILNSKFHSNVIRTRAANTSSVYLQLELNAIMLGESVAFVTAPNEIVDRYDLAGSRKDEDNDWLELVNELTYGTPFVLGYTNEGKGYIPNSLDYTYNTDEYYEITGWGADGDDYFGAGSYEANTSRFARGTGEDIIQEFKWMLNMVNNGYYTATCQACGEEVQWQPLIAEQAALQYLGTGHYYLAEDLPAGARGKNQKMIQDGDVLCLDLNGHKSEIIGRSINIAKGGTMNLMDSKGGGAIISYSGGNNVGGGTVAVASGGVLNVYGGTIQFVHTDVADGVYETAYGGAISCGGIVNVYGGTLIGDQMEKSSYYPETSTSEANGSGGTVFVSNNGVFNVEGGRIIAGKAADGAKGDCVFAYGSKSYVNVSGDAIIDEIYYNYSNSNVLTVTGAFTGSIHLAFEPNRITDLDDLVIGKSVNADLSGARISCINDSSYDLSVSGTDLVMTKAGENAVATVYGPGGARYYDALDAAVDAYLRGYIKLLKDTGEAVTVDKTAYLDLNGFDIASVSVADSCTLYCMDSQTDDYVADDYGMIGSVSGNVLGVPQKWALAEDGYLMVQEEGKTSFHRVNLQIYAMTLRPDDVGLYYNSNFIGDEVVARNVKKFGVALSVMGVPTEKNIQDIARCSEFTDFRAGLGGNAESNTGTLLKGVMKITNAANINKRNASFPVYGRAYIETDSGYMFGEYEVRDLKEQIEGVDAMWSTLSQTQQDKMVSLYEKFTFVMKNWNIPNVIEACPTGRDSADIPFDSLV